MEICWRIRDVGEDYLQYYCSGIGTNNDHEVPEGVISDDVRKLFFDMEWINYDEERYAIKYNNEVYLIWIDRLVIYEKEIVITGINKMIGYMQKHLPIEIRTNIIKWIFEQI